MGQSNHNSKPQSPRPLSSEQLLHLSARLFAPNLRPPRFITFPTPPSLAASKLPPPCAEIDERPPYRARRFRRWRDAVPSLFLVVLDPRRRFHLRRYHSYEMPNPNIITRGPVLTQVDPLPLRTTPPHSPLALPVSPPPLPGHPKIKLPKGERKARYQRLLQYKYALDQEHERRFRKGMACLMPRLVAFERVNVQELESKTWNLGVNTGLVMYWTQFFRDIRKNSTYLFHYLKDRSEIQPVPRRDELHKAVKAEDQRRETKREKKEEKQRDMEDAKWDLAKARGLELSVDEADKFDQCEPERTADILLSDRVEEGDMPRIDPIQGTNEYREELSDTSTASTVSIRTPTDTTYRPRLRPSKTNIHPTYSAGPKKPPLHLRASVPAGETESLGCSSLPVHTGSKPVTSWEMKNIVANGLAQLVMSMQAHQINDSNEIDPKIPAGEASDTRASSKRRMVIIRSPKGIDNAAITQLLPNLIQRIRESSSGTRTQKVKEDAQGEVDAGISSDRLSRLADLQEEVVPAQISTTLDERSQIMPDRISVTRAPSPEPHSPIDLDESVAEIPNESGSIHLDSSLIDIPRTGKESAVLNEIAEMPDEVDAKGGDDSDLEPTDVSSQEVPYGELNMDQDTAAPFVASAQAPSTTSREVAYEWSTDGDLTVTETSDSEAEDYMQKSLLGTKGDDEVSESDTELTARQLIRLPSLHLVE